MALFARFAERALVRVVLRVAGGAQARRRLEAARGVAAVARRVLVVADERIVRLVVIEAGGRPVAAFVAVEAFCAERALVERVGVAGGAAGGRRALVDVVLVARLARDFFVALGEREARRRAVELGDRLALELVLAGAGVAAQALVVAKLLFMDVCVGVAAHAADRAGVEPLPLGRGFAAVAGAAVDVGVRSGEREAGVLAVVEAEVGAPHRRGVAVGAIADRRETPLVRVGMAGDACAIGAGALGGGVAGGARLPGVRAFQREAGLLRVVEADVRPDEPRRVAQRAPLLPEQRLPVDVVVAGRAVGDAERAGRAEKPLLMAFDAFYADVPRLDREAAVGALVVIELHLGDRLPRGGVVAALALAQRRAQFAVRRLVAALARRGRLEERRAPLLALVVAARAGEAG